MPGFHPPDHRDCIHRDEMEGNMKLFGNYLSPYTRRVGVTLNLYAIPFELENLSVFVNPDPVKSLNPVVRIPTLLLENGEPVFESSVILDAIDEMVPETRRMLPASGAARRHVLRVVATATGTIDKAVFAFYERRFHPEEKVHEPWIEHNDKQVSGGLAALNEYAAKAGEDGWLAETETMSQGDIATAIAFTFTNKVRPNLDVASNYPDLAAFAARCEAMQAFIDCPVPDKPPGS